MEPDDTAILEIAMSSYVQRGLPHRFAGSFYKGCKLLARSKEAESARLFPASPKAAATLWLEAGAIIAAFRLKLLTLVSFFSNRVAHNEERAWM